MRIFNNYFAGKRVLVTGHTGFKGAWLSVWLKELGAEVAGFSLDPPTEPSLFEQVGLEEKIHSIRGDVRDFNHLHHVIQEWEPEIVFHLAAQSLVRASYTEPLETISTNVLGAANLLEAIRQMGASVRVCQIVSSDKCYENDESNHPYREGDRLGGRDIYSASKGCAEILVSAYRNSFFSSEGTSQPPVSLSSVRAGNVIGGGDWSADRIIPDCIRALSKGEPVVLRNPNSVRPWQFVLDALAGYLLLAQHQANGSREYANAWNFGPESAESLTVVKLAEAVIKKWGTGSWEKARDWKSDPGNEPYEAKFLRLDTSKARTLLQWRPVYTGEEGIRETINWYKETRKEKREEVYQYSVNQIQSYISRAKEHNLAWATQEKVVR